MYGSKLEPLNARKPALSGTVLWLMDCTGRSSCWSNHHLLLKSQFFAGQITVRWSNHIFLLVKATQNLDISAKVLDTKPNFTCGYDIWDNYNGASAMVSPYRVGTDCSNNSPPGLEKSFEPPLLLHRFVHSCGGHEGSPATVSKHHRGLL